MTELSIAGAMLGFMFGWMVGAWMERETRPRRPSGPPRGSYGPRRIYHFNPQTIAECGGPCEQLGPCACDCGAITPIDRPVRPRD